MGNSVGASIAVSMIYLKLDATQYLTSVQILARLNRWYPCSSLCFEVKNIHYQPMSAWANFIYFISAVNSRCLWPGRIQSTWSGLWIMAPIVWCERRCLMKVTLCQFLTWARKARDTSVLADKTERREEVSAPLSGRPWAPTQLQISDMWLNYCNCLSWNNLNWYQS